MQHSRFQYPHGDLAVLLFCRVARSPSGSTDELSGARAAGSMSFALYPARVRSSETLGGSTMISICRSSFTCQVSLECRRANLLYSPAIDALEHDRIAIQQYVECDNPHGITELPDSQKGQRD